jgi:hypothetical protein
VNRSPFNYGLPLLGKWRIGGVYKSYDSRTFTMEVEERVKE